MATKHAVALRAFNHVGESYAPGSAFPITAGYLAEWSAPGVDLVREATAAEIAKVTGEKPARRAPTKRLRKSKEPAPAAAAPIAAPEPADTDPAAAAA